MQTSRPSSPTKMPSLSAPKSTTTLWTARLVATLWKLAVTRARKLRRHSQGAADQVDIMYGSALDGSTVMCGEDALELDETSIMHEAALSVVASGVVSLADLEAVTGFRLSKNHDAQDFPVKDDDASSEAATDTSDACSIADSDVSDSTLDEETTVVSPKTKSLQHLSAPRVASSSKPGKWVCIGYGRYVKVQD
ncbi:hypothetical protein KRP22_001207 [Phytophthora ramorum]|uniref:Uncharacterized protein n=1 Tax=Phytophthora ramorum TaxID=164328 RepID=H3GQ17_PHYRM|nr:hypothetical protein KRP23_7965 [Phytophthora ramorum]KAH7508542.1 hypothetical protein KRP22_56 [Phytophthora ramorum]